MKTQKTYNEEKVNREGGVERSVFRARKYAYTVHTGRPTRAIRAMLDEE